MPVPVAQCVDKAAIGNAGIHGIELLTDKHSLARVSRLLGWEGRFVPETAMSVGHDTLEWLAKRGSHRGVYPLAAAGRERSLAGQPSAELVAVDAQRAQREQARARVGQRAAESGGVGAGARRLSAGMRSSSIDTHAAQSRTHSFSSLALPTPQVRERPHHNLLVPAREPGRDGVPPRC